MEESLVITYTPVSVASEDEPTVYLEQKEWDPYEGVTSNTAMVNALANLLYSTEPSVLDSGYGLPSALGTANFSLSGTRSTNVDCDNLIDGEMVAKAYAYPSPGTLHFTLRLSHGQITSNQVHIRSYRDLIQVRLTDPDSPLSPEYPVYSLSSYDWLGDCYDEDGAVVPSPQITSNGTELFVSRKVYGTVDVSYRVKRNEVEMLIPPRSGVTGKAAFDTVLYAVFSGAVTFEEIDPSPVVEAESSCVDWDEFVEFYPKEYPPVADHADKIEEWDYCTLEKTNEYIS